MDENSNSPIRSVDRALSIIETLTEYRKGLGLVELSNKVGLNKTTTYRMICAIMSHGWITKDPSTGNYRLTLRLFELGSKVSSQTSLLSIARPYLEELSEKTGETLHFVVQEGADVVYLYKEESSLQSIKMESRVGMRNPMFVTGVGKAILCHLGHDEIKRLWNVSKTTVGAKNSILDFEEMMAELKRTKERGWALDDEENEVGVRCVAVPILDRQNHPLAAISISGSVFHITPDKYDYYANLLKDAVAKISKQIGM